MAKFEIFKNNLRKYQFRFLDESGKILLFSQGYASKRDAIKGIAATKKNASDKTKYKLGQVETGDEIFEILSGNNEIVAHSPKYSTRALCEESIEIVSQVAALATETDASPDQIKLMTKAGHGPLCINVSFNHEVIGIQVVLVDANGFAIQTRNADADSIIEFNLKHCSFYTRPLSVRAVFGSKILKTAEVLDEKAIVDLSISNAPLSSSEKLLERHRRRIKGRNKTKEMLEAPRSRKYFVPKETPRINIFDHMIDAMKSSIPTQKSSDSQNLEKNNDSNKIPLPANAGASKGRTTFASISHLLGARSETVRFSDSDDKLISQLREIGSEERRAGSCGDGQSDQAENGTESKDSCK